jgi:NTP pyrophosphatase (non-canonical NTP hydrolase)
MEIKELAKHIHNLAKEKGWHDDYEDIYIAKAVSNLHGEVSEFWEAFRRAELDEQCDKAIGLTCAEEELADIVIRALDMAERLKIDMQRAIEIKHQYNKSRSFRHGGKRA